MFDVRLTEEQQAFQQMARKFAQEEIKPLAIELDQKPTWEERVPWDLLRKGSQLGFRTFVLSEENGGAGASDHLTACLVAEELAAGDTGTAYYFMLTARRARDWFEIRATPEQREYFVPKFLADDTYFTTIAIHEPDTDLGFDYFTETPENARFRTRATEQPDGSWVINGAKNFQTVGYLAKLLVVMAHTDSGPQAFLVEGDSPGLKRHPMSKIGRRVGQGALTSALSSPLRRSHSGSDARRSRRR
jgi:alkylation response protein AidB-like acyl-CoA dehydrogenase